MKENNKDNTQYVDSDTRPWRKARITLESGQMRTSCSWKGTANKPAGPYSDCGFNFYHQQGPKKAKRELIIKCSQFVLHLDRSKHKSPGKKKKKFNAGRQQLFSLVTNF